MPLTCHIVTCRTVTPPPPLAGGLNSPNMTPSPPPLRQVEFILMGGTFMSLPGDYRDYFIRNLHDALSGAAGTSRRMPGVEFAGTSSLRRPLARECEPGAEPSSLRYASCLTLPDTARAPCPNPPAGHRGSCVPESALHTTIACQLRPPPAPCSRTRRPQQQRRARGGRVQRGEPHQVRGGWGQGTKHARRGMRACTRVTRVEKGRGGGAQQGDMSTM